MVSSIRTIGLIISGYHQTEGDGEEGLNSVQKKCNGNGIEVRHKMFVERKERDDAFNSPFG